VTYIGLTARDALIYRKIASEISRLSDYLKLELGADEYDESEGWYYIKCCAPGI